MEKIILKSVVYLHGDTVNK